MDLLADVLTEPPDRTVLVCRDHRGDYHVIWRDDALARECEADPGQRWWTSSDPDVAVDWPTATVYAAAVYEVSAVPAAICPGADVPTDLTAQPALFGAWLARR